MVISYLRFSTAEQVKGDSTRRQLDMSEKYAADRGWEINSNLSDKGVSAFRGSNATTGALSKLLKLVEEKRIPRGSVLLVESLDRLSRNDIEEALELFMSLTRSGLRIITLADGHEYSKGQIKLHDLMYSLMVMSRAHEESATKSHRIGAAWKAKRARISKEPLTAMLPAWLKLQDDKIVIDDQKVKIVQRIFAMIVEGRSISYALKTLNAAGVVIGTRRDYWVRSYVAKILHNRAVIGEFQPHRIIHKDGKRTRVPDGEPIKGYFPAIISENDFYAVQATLKSRTKHTGPSSTFTNLFKGLLFDSDDKSPLQVRSKGSRSYASAACIAGRSSHGCIGFPVTAFEAAFLARVSEKTSLDLKDDRAAELNQELRGVLGNLQTVNKRIADINRVLSDADNDQSPTALIPVLSKLDAQQKALTEKHEAIQQQLAAAQMGSPREAAETIAKLLKGSMTGSMNGAARFELQQAIAQLAERIDCHIDRDGPLTSCDVRATLKNKSVISYTATLKNRCPSEVLITDDGGCKTYIQVAIDGEKPASLSMYTESKIKELWQNAVRPAEIAEQCEVSLTQVYRIAGKLPRLKKFKPANRWDAKQLEKAK